MFMIAIGMAIINISSTVNSYDKNDRPVSEIKIRFAVIPDSDSVIMTLPGVFIIADEHMNIR